MPRGELRDNQDSILGWLTLHCRVRGKGTQAPLSLMWGWLLRASRVGCVRSAWEHTGGSGPRPASRQSLCQGLLSFDHYSSTKWGGPGWSPGLQPTTQTSATLYARSPKFPEPALPGQTDRRAALQKWGWRWDTRDRDLGYS